MSESDASKQDDSLEVQAEPSKTIPKLTTKVGVAKANDNVVLSFIFAFPNEKAQLIERVILDPNLADELVDLIKKLREAPNSE